MGDDFDERHLGDRVEEVDTAEAFRCLQATAQSLQQDRGGVGGQDGIALHLCFALLVDGPFDLRVLRHNLDDEIGLGETVTGDIGHQPVHGRLAFAVRVDALLVVVRSTFDGRGDVLDLAVLQGDAEAFLGADGSDVAAHDAGADDVDMFDAVLGTLGVAFEFLAQEKRADQVARGIADHQLGETLGLGLAHGRKVVTVFAPQLDHGVRCRIVGLVGLFGGLLFHLAGDDRADRAEGHGAGT